MQGGNRPGSRSAVSSNPETRIIVHRGPVVMYEITEENLDFFASGSRSLFTSIASGCATAAISVGVPLALSDNIGRGLEIGMWCAVVTALVLGSFAAFLAVKEFRAYGRKLKEFKETAQQDTSTS